MNYYHIIYNSSQTTRAGHPGFGLRDITEGTDPELLKALGRQGCYQLQYSHPGLDSGTLGDDPTLIRLIEPEYFYRTVEYGNKTAWVLGRKIAVGFDYEFYENGNPTRLGNYVADIYSFDNAPDRQVFEALYENPAAGSMHFIPASPEPRTDNEEMRRISLGKPADMAPENLPFKAASLPAITPASIKLLFAFHTHLADKKPVAVIIDDKEAVPVIASLMRILPDELLAKATFITNYNGLGIPDGAALVCVDPKRRNDFIKSKWTHCDLTNAEPPATTEASQLYGDMTDALTAGNMEHLLNLTRWLFSDAYTSVKGMAEEGREIAFRYTIEPQTLTPDLLNKALKSDDGVKALVAIIAAGADPEILDRHFDSEFSAASDVKDIKMVIDRLLDLNAKGLHCANDAIDRAKSHIDDVIMTSPAAFEEFFTLAGGAGPASLAPYSQFLDLESLKDKRNSYLSYFKPSNWRRLYTLFFTTPVDEKALIRRAIADKLPQSELSALLFETIAPDRLVELAVELMTSSPDTSEALLPIISQLQDQGIAPKGRRYFDIFADRREQPQYAELMVKEYAKSVPLAPVEKEVERIVELANTPSLVRAVTDVKLSGLLKSLKSAALSAGKDASEKVAPLCDKIAKLPLKSRIVGDITLLADVLRGKYGSDHQKVAILAAEIGNEKAAMAALPAMAEKCTDPAIISAIANFLTKKGIAHADILPHVAKAPGKSLAVWFATLYNDIKKKRGTIIVEELTAAGIAPERAVEILETALPDDHKAYLKSLQPNVFVRFGRWVKSLFGSKNNKPDTTHSADAELPAAPAPKKPAKSTKAAGAELPAPPAPAPKKPAKSTKAAAAELPADRASDVIPPAAPDPDEIVENEGGISLD